MIIQIDFPRSTYLQMEIVNTISRGKLNCNFDLKELCNQIKHNLVLSVTHQIKQPEQAIIRLKNGNTLLIFKSGAFRIMGKNDDLCNYLTINEIFSFFSDDLPEITTQTMTATYTIGKRLSLTKMAEEPFTNFTAECFPAIHLYKFKPIHINIFSTGRVICCGIKNLDIILILTISFTNMLFNYFVV